MKAESRKRCGKITLHGNKLRVVVDPDDRVVGMALLPSPLPRFGVLVVLDHTLSLEEWQCRQVELVDGWGTIAVLVFERVEWHSATGSLASRFVDLFFVEICLSYIFRVELS